MNNKQTESLNDYVLHSALRLISLEEQYLKNVCEKNLSLRELHVLEAVSCLAPTHSNTMAAIARYLHLSPASLTTAVNVLVNKGYLAREYSADDRRVIYVQLTEIGADANTKYLAFVKKYVDFLAAGIDEAAGEVILETVARATEYLESAGKDGNVL